MARESGSERLLFYLALLSLFLSLLQAGLMISITSSATAAGSVGLCVNRPPVIQPVPDQVVFVGQSLVIQVNASDPNNQSLFYFDNTSLFNISSTGEISFIATLGDVGVHSVLILVQDNGTGCNTTSNVSFKITVSTIPADAVVVAPVVRAGAGGGGCTVVWLCDGFGPCVSGKQERKCVNTGTCVAPKEKFDYRVCEEVECQSDAQCPVGYFCDDRGHCALLPAVPPTVEVPAPGLPDFFAPFPGPPEFFERRPALLVGMLSALLAVILLALLLTFWPPRKKHHPYICRYSELGGHHGEFHHGHKGS